MTQAQIKRFECSERGTAGALLVNDELVCMTLERPWVQNAVNISCVPTGIYESEEFRSNRHGSTYKVLNVPNRSGILFHKGNEIVHSTGCILLGQMIRVKSGRLSLVHSALAFEEFKRVLLGVNQFTLRVCLV